MHDVLVITTWKEAFEALWSKMDSLQHKLNLLLSWQSAQGDIMATVTEKLDAIITVVNKLSVDVQTALTAAGTKHDADLARIAELEALVVVLESNDATDAASIHSLKDTIESMKAADEVASVALSDKLDSALVSLNALDDVVPDTLPGSI